MMRSKSNVLLVSMAMAMAWGSALPANAELVMRLDASVASTLTLSSDVTTGTVFGFPDARQSGLNFVEQWGQQYGATSNPELNPRFVPYRTSNFNPNLFRPTYDPNGLGAGKASVNFDAIPGDAVLGGGQRMIAPLDNLINSNQYTIFFVAKRNDDRFQNAFGQDFNYRPSGWGVGIDGAGNWEGAPGGYDGNADPGGATDGTSDGVGVFSVIGTSIGTLDFESRDSNGAVVVNSHEQNDYGIYSGGDFVLGNRGGWDGSNSNPFNGRIGEIAIFNTELTLDQRTAVRAFLENKWLNAPAPTAGQITTAQGLLQQPAPTGLKQIVRYEFRKTLPNDPDATLLNPDLVATNVVASDINSGGGFPPTEGVAGGFSASAVGVSLNSAYLGTSWNGNTTEQSPMNESPYYLGFSVTPAAGKQIVPSKLSFALARGEDASAAPNGTDSFAVWIDKGDGFVRASANATIGDAPGTDSVVPYFFHTVDVDLSSVGPLNAESEIRIYLWHEGELVNPDGNENARVDNVRLIGDVRDMPAGLLGDYNNNGVVDAADYTLWRNNPASLQNDASPSSVTFADYQYWKAHFGETNLGSGQGAGGSQVPEPGMLLVIAAILSLGTIARIRFTCK